MAHVSAAERRPQLIAAAIDLMSREGVAAGSTRAIAAELGVAQATVHYTFGSKEDLYRAVLESLTADLITGIQKAVERAADLEEALRATADAFIIDLGDRPDLSLLWFELIAFSLRSPELREVVAKYHQDASEIATTAFARIAERTGQEYAVPPGELAGFLLNGLDGASLSFLIRGEDTPGERTRRDLDQLVRATLTLAEGTAPAASGTAPAAG
ncbi:TetR/AcrR family transcriptional regulator [Streptomyces sp. CAU 1734]|uniref:TetR/AcrR family transcriptional regulator n=1 Tax=Streptomyces sp. CAU 1734 TaxID=3140360 RepID=UPI003260DB3D